MNESCRSNAHIVSPGDDGGSGGAHENKADVYICAEYVPESSHANLGKKIFNPGGQGDGFEKTDIDVGKQERPGADETPTRS